MFGVMFNKQIFLNLVYINEFEHINIRACDRHFINVVPLLLTKPLYNDGAQQSLVRLDAFSIDHYD